jgi:tetratricopeptide (TPR) repeat protein
LRQIILLFALFTISGVSFAQTVEKVTPGAANGTRLDDLRVQGYEALYSLDFETANRIFKEMVRLFPDHPAGPQCLAAALWLHELNRSRHRQASLYSPESFYAGEEKADPHLVEQFHNWTRTAALFAEARLRRNPRDLEALYFLGVTEGLRAVFAAAVERKFMVALTHGLRAVDRHREVLKLDPNFHDAELSIGMYDFIVGSLPLPIRIMASIGGVRGSKKRGLETLERVAREGHWARGIACLLLIDVYKREKRWTEALAAARELATRYPRNYLFQLQAADALVARAATLRQTKGASASAASADQDEAFRIFESLLQDRTKGKDSGGAVATDLIHFRYGEALLMTGQPQRATEEFQTAARQIGGEPGLITMARLRTAQSMDLSGRRREALAEYGAVLERPKFQRLYEEARRGLREPYRMNDRTQD